MLKNVNYPDILLLTICFQHVIDGWKFIGIFVKILKNLIYHQAKDYRLITKPIWANASFFKISFFCILFHPLPKNYFFYILISLIFIIYYYLLLIHLNFLNNSHWTNLSHPFYLLFFSSFTFFTKFPHINLLLIYLCFK